MKKCKKYDDVLFINVSEKYEKGKINCCPEYIKKIVETYQYRKEEDRYSRKISMEEIAKNEFNLNISRYISTSITDEPLMDKLQKEACYRFFKKYPVNEIGK